MRRLIVGLLLASTVGMPAFADDRTSVYYAQKKLQSLGYEAVTPDGRDGPVTRKALADAGEKYGFGPTITDLFKHFSTETVSQRTTIADAAQMAAIEETVKRDLMDPFSAHIRDVYALRSGLICGEVNAKNRFGAYIGWRTFMVKAMTVHDGQWFPGVAMIDAPNDDFVYAICALDIEL